MLPRKLSFPQLPPPPYPDKRSFQPTTDDLRALQLLHPPNFPPPQAPARSARRTPPRRANPSPPLPRTPSPPLPAAPVVVVDEGADERPARQNRPRAQSHNQLGQLLISEPQDRPVSTSTSISASSSSSSSASSSTLLSTPRSPRELRSARLQQPPPHPPPPHPPPKPPIPPPSERHDDFDILSSEPFTIPSPTAQIPQQRSRFRSLAALRLSRGTRQTTAPITEGAPQQTAEERRRDAAEDDARRAIHEREMEAIARRNSAQDLAKEYVQTVIETLLQGKLPSDDERATIFESCTQACEKEDLDVSTVLQEMSIEGYPPIYWAIVNRSVAAEGSGISPDSLVLALLKACRPFSPATLAAIRVACMVASDNVLLQRLFRSIPQLSPISTRDALLLGPANEEDRVDVEEKRNGTGSWTALIRIPRFRLRMRVSQSVSVEFVASGRIWTLAFSAVVETSSKGRGESRWYLSLELGEHSPRTPVNASLVILGSSDAAEEDTDESRTIHFGHPMSDLCPGRDKAIKIRLDDGPIGPHLLNESSVLVDSNKTLHARLTQSTVTGSGTGTDTSSGSSRDRDTITPSPEITYSPVSALRPLNPHPSWSPPLQDPLPPAGRRIPTGTPSPGRKKKKRPSNEVHVTLRRGGR